MRPPKRPSGRASTVTLPLILARDADPGLRDLDAKTTDEAVALCDRIAATGVLPEARTLALAYVAEAKELLDELRLGGERERALALVADSVVERYA